MSEKKVTVHEIPKAEEHLPEPRNPEPEKTPLPPVTEAVAESDIMADVQDKPGESIYFPPSVAGSMEPVYPPAAIKKGLEGVVILELYVDRLGNLVSTEIKQSSGHAVLDKAALKGASRCSFKPGIRNGIAVDGYFTVEVQFRLGR